MHSNDPTIQWLLEAGDASVRYFTLTELLEMPADTPEAQAARAQILESPRVQTLLSGQLPNGGFGVHPYQKWTGAHWRLVSLVELGIPPDEPHARLAAGQVLNWLCGDSHRRRIPRINGLTRRCASQEGNALAVCSRLDLSGDERVQTLAASLIEWQWPGGGWNCDRRPAARHASFYESLAPLWGLIEYHQATGDPGSLVAARRAAELFLSHHVFRSDKTGEVIDPEWLRLHYPLYWRYDILQALTILSRLGPLTDPRLQDALNLIEARRLSSGQWRVEACYWRPPGKAASNVEVVDWGRRGPHTMLTLNALRVLKSAARL